MASRRTHPQGAARPVDGLLVVDKPGLPPDVDPADAGYLLTSHDVVQRVRRWSGQRRIGHTGTLDPMASGVLVLCLGVATRLVEYYQGHDKHYTATVQLGVETDTYDAVGAVVAQQPVPPLDVETIEVALAQFQGVIEQKPPRFSALKQGGESLYRKARRGEAVEIEARTITIHRLTLISYQPPSLLRLQTHCSAGTYIRSLAFDLGRALGTVAHLRALRRDAARAFTTQEAHSLESIETAAQEGTLEKLLLPLGTGLHLPVLVLNGEESARLGHGQKVWVPSPVADAAEGSLFQGVDAEGRLAGILRVLQTAPAGDRLLCKADKWLAPQFEDAPH